MKQNVTPMFPQMLSPQYSFLNPMRAEAWSPTSRSNGKVGPSFTRRKYKLFISAPVGHHNKATQTHASRGVVSDQPTQWMESTDQNSCNLLL